MASRLPKPGSLRQAASSPGRDQPSKMISHPTIRSASGTLKRQRGMGDIDEEGDHDGLPPRTRTKLETGQPTLPRSAASGNLNNGVSSLTQPRAPNLTSAARARATSAPPAKSAARSVSGQRMGAGAQRVPLGKVANPNANGRSKPTSAGSFDDRRFKDLQEQVSSIESARAADAARLERDMNAERTKVAELQANHLALSRELASAKSQELMQRRELVTTNDELENLKRKHSREVSELEMDLRKKERELRELREDLRMAQTDLERTRESESQLKSTISHHSTAQITLSTQNTTLHGQVNALQAALDTASSTISQLRFDLEVSAKEKADLEQEAREAEMTRRKLHNMVQELKGNIRVFCRVRPQISSDGPAFSSGTSSTDGTILETSPHAAGEIDLKADITYPDRCDHKEIVLGSTSESATGQERKEQWNFSFDRVFEPHSTQEDVFDEISQLVQSCTDGYNVCIFAYGQTGSGKSFTMEGGPTPESVGMIPRAVRQVFGVTEDLKSKGWEYVLEGQFLEIYNETINDLLGTGEIDKKKHEIKHEKGSTRVTDVVIVPLKSTTQVQSLLSLAQSRRSVAATLMNERSSRSHSVFTLRIRGQNVHTGEICEGSLNLVDLAGSERLKESGAGNDKDRLRETQAINRSLSALGDVIAALGEKSEKGEKHIPYRNSKLTYLLQNSLSGNSKTLMFLNLSPLGAHLNESLCSLRFATKVNNTTIGTAKKQSRIASAPS